jgi:predicted transcriptional regulator
MNTLRSFFETTLWAQLGPLERQVLEAVWGRGSATVHEVREDVAIWQTYTTIMTTMDRLFKKGLFDRTPDGRAFRYSARYSPKELQSMSAASSIKQILESEYALLHLSYFVEAVGAHSWGRENRSDICRARGSCLACVFRRGVLLGIRAGSAHMGGCPRRVLETFVEFGQFAVRTADFAFCLLRVRHCVLYFSIILAT